MLSAALAARTTSSSPRLVAITDVCCCHGGTLSFLLFSRVSLSPLRPRSHGLWLAPLDQKNPIAQLAVQAAGRPLPETVDPALTSIVLEANGRGAFRGCIALGQGADGARDALGLAGVQRRAREQEGGVCVGFCNAGTTRLCWWFCARSLLSPLFGFLSSCEGVLWAKVLMVCRVETVKNCIHDSAAGDGAHAVAAETAAHASSNAVGSRVVPVASAPFVVMDATQPEPDSLAEVEASLDAFQTLNCVRPVDLRLGTAAGPPEVGEEGVRTEDKDRLDGAAEDESVSVYLAESPGQLGASQAGDLCVCMA